VELHPPLQFTRDITRIRSRSLGLIRSVAALIGTPFAGAIMGDISISLERGHYHFAMTLGPEMLERGWIGWYIYG
jgi:hypothetical protein